RDSKTYSTKDSRVVTHRSTNLAIRSLTMGERTGSRIFFNLWPYVPTVQKICSSVTSINRTPLEAKIALIWVLPPKDNMSSSSTSEKSQDDKHRDVAPINS
ncbi:hypothetical protein BJ508DRAFT_218616, partial [Ascobolus immersus RN42]